MKKLLLPLISIILFGCITQKKCNERYPVQIVTHDSIVTTVTTKTVGVLIPGENIIFHDSIPCPYEYHKSVTKKHLTATVTIHKGLLSVDCKSDSLNKIITYQDSVIRSVHNEVKVVKPEIQYKEHWYTKPLIGLFILNLIAIIVLLLIERFKKVV